MRSPTAWATKLERHSPDVAEGRVQTTSSDTTQTEILTRNWNSDMRLDSILRRAPIFAATRFGTTSNARVHH